MSEQEKKNIVGFGTDLTELTREEARDIFDLLFSMDEHMWMILAEKFPHPPSALIELVKKCEAKFPSELKIPTETECIFFSTGAISPSKRAIEIAMFIVDNPNALKKFEDIAKPILSEREKMMFDGIALATRAKTNDTLQ